MKMSKSNRGFLIILGIVTAFFLLTENPYYTIPTPTAGQQEESDDVPYIQADDIISSTTGQISINPGFSGISFQAVFPEESNDSTDSNIIDPIVDFLQILFRDIIPSLAP